MEATAYATSSRRFAQAAFVVLFWIVAAIPVLAAPSEAVKLVAIVGAAFAYMRLAAREATLHHALTVGITWLLFDIVVELVAASVVGHGWYELIGSPAKPLLRDLQMVTWIIAPAIFARRESTLLS